MAIGTSFGVLINQLRCEIGSSTSPAQGLNDLPILQNVIQRIQEFLYDDFNWPHMLKDVDTDLMAGQRYYTFDPLINFNRIYNAYVNWSVSWEPLEFGIDPTYYNYNNPDLNNRADPALRWQHYDTNSFEVWPVPAGTVTQKIRFRCIRNLRPLLADSDTADLDDRLIVLFAAAELLARSKEADASAKQQLARQRYNQLRGQQIKKDLIVMGGGVRRSRRQDWNIRVVGS